MGQLEAFEKGEQGKNLITTDPHGEFKGTTYSYDGKGLPVRAGSSRSNDIHVDDPIKPSGHIHRDINLPFANGENGLAVRAQTLNGSKYNRDSKYEKPTDISEKF